MIKIIRKIFVLVVRLFVWFFVLTTALSVTLAMLSCVVYPDSQNRIMCTGGGDNIKSAWGLTYYGWGGAVLAFVQVAVVLSALWASMRWKTAYRRAGHIVLILWAGLWAVNAFYIFGDGTFNLIYVLPFFLLCTCIRAVMGWRERN